MPLITIKDKNRIIKRLLGEKTNFDGLLENLKEMLLENGYPKEKIDEYLGKDL